MDKWSEYLNESPLIERQFYGNPLLAWLVAGATFAAVLFFLRLGLGIVRRCAAALAERRNFYLTHAFLELSRSTKLWFLLIVSAYLGSLVLDLPHTATDWLVWLTVTVLLVQLAFWADVLIALLLRRYVQRQLETDAASVTTMTAVGFFARLAAWTVTLLLVLRYAHIDVSTFLTGLGIGGVAVALAAQSVLVDLFASLSIVLDKPFILGDFIAVQDFLGSVEHIGLKTTRLRSLSGEQLVFSNSDLLGGRIRNYKRMTERRIEFTFGLRFTTPHDKLAAVPDMIRQAIAAQGRTRFDRAHLKSFGDCRSCSRWSITCSRPTTTSIWTSSTRSTWPCCAASPSRAFAWRCRCKSCVCIEPQKIRLLIAGHYPTPPPQVSVVAPHSPETAADENLRYKSLHSFTGDGARPRLRR